MLVNIKKGQGEKKRRSSLHTVWYSFHLSKTGLTGAEVHSFETLKTKCLISLWERRSNQYTTLTYTPIADVTECSRSKNYEISSSIYNRGVRSPQGQSQPEFSAASSVDQEIRPQSWVWGRCAPQTVILSSAWCFFLGLLRKGINPAPAVSFIFWEKTSRAAQS